MLALLLLSALCLGAQGFGDNSDMDGISSFSLTSISNSFIDTVLATVRREVARRGLDPLSLPDQSAGFSKKVVFVRVKGSAKLYNGRLAGLRTLHRSGSCSPSLNRKTNRVSFRCSLGIDNLSGGYSGSAKFMKIRVKAKARVSVARVRVRFTISAKAKQGAVGRLDHFSITKLSTIGVRVSGLGPLNWILSTLSKVVVNAVKPRLRRTIEGAVRSEVNKALSKHPIPKIF